MEYFYGFNVSGVMTLWVGWGEAVSFEICKMQKIWYCLSRNLDWPPKIKICAEVHFSSLPFYHKNNASIYKSGQLLTCLSCGRAVLLMMLTFIEM